MQNENESKHDFDLPEGDDKKGVRVHTSQSVCESCEG